MEDHREVESRLDRLRVCCTTIMLVIHDWLRMLDLPQLLRLMRPTTYLLCPIRLELVEHTGVEPVSHP